MNFLVKTIWGYSSNGISDVLKPTPKPNTKCPKRSRPTDFKNSVV